MPQTSCTSGSLSTDSNSQVLNLHRKICSLVMTTLNFTLNSSRKKPQQLPTCNCTRSYVTTYHSTKPGKKLHLCLHFSIHIVPFTSVTVLTSLKSCMIQFFRINWVTPASHFLLCLVFLPKNKPFFTFKKEILQKVLTQEHRNGIHNPT